MKRDERKKMLEKLEPRLEVFRRAARRNALQTAWLRQMRQALGIPAAELAHRLETSRTWVYRVEEDEAKGRVTLEALDAVAHAMGCRVVYGLVPYRDQPLEELAASLKEYPKRDTPRIVARRERKTKKMWDNTQEWRLKRVWEQAADRKAAKVRAEILGRAKSYNWSLEAAEAAAKKAREGGPGEQGAEGSAPVNPTVPRTAEEMRGMKVGGAEALRGALADRLRR